MSYFTIIRSPWTNEFKAFLRNTNKEVMLASPYIKTDIAQIVVDSIKDNVKARYLNSFKLSNYLQGSSDLSALKLFVERGVAVRSHQQLHAKVFVFDDEKAVVTSGNLTNGGLRNNYEYGLLVEDKSLVKEIRQDFLSLFNNQETTYSVTNEIIEKAENIISSVPKERKPKLPLKEKALFKAIDNDHLITEKFTGGSDAVATNLTGWKRAVFILLDELPDEIVNLNRIYAFERVLQAKFPRNKHVRDKLRQQLQYLRNLGLLEFLGRGRYKKLWG